MVSSKTWRLVLFTLGGVILLFAGAIIFLFHPRTAQPPSTLLSKTGDEFNILLIGKDARALNPAQDNGGRTRIPRENIAHSDIVIVAHLNFKLNRLNLVALPRDLLVEVPGITAAASSTDFNRMEKLTHTFAIGGAPLLRRTVEKLLGIQIHRFIALDFDTFRILFAFVSRFIGPIQIGNIKLRDPDQALKFVRQRNYLKYDDLDRCRNTLNFIKTIARRLWLITGTRAGDILIDQFFKIVGTDTDLTPAELKYLLSQLRQNRFNPDLITLVVLVSEGRPVTLDRYAMTLSCYLPVYPEIEKQIQRYLYDDDRVAALDFMTQQFYSWPDYMTREYNLLPEYQNDTLKRLELVKKIIQQTLPAPDSGL
jgi:anionic cell wall polymer biosynthesis LytR-Cps2A-Psr (LCP) family protein|uniref:LytR family transcriptional regulator n=1 Tax=candidate division WOR-3 bacterium TaxID=2052148 RepID=A0A7V3PSI1_UNCW3